MAHSDLDLIVVDLPDPKGRPGPRIRDLVLPARALITLVTRGDGVVAPTGNTRLLGWDQVTVLAPPEDEPEVRVALLEPFERQVETEESAARVIDTEPTELLTATGVDQLGEHVVLVGHGRVGAVLARFLRQRELPFVVIEQDRMIAMALRRERTHVLHGNAADPALLDRAGIRNAKLLLVTTAEAVSARRAIEHGHRVNPRLEVVTRVHHDTQRKVLSAFPRTQCVQGEVELAYAMARLMLLASGVSAIETEAILIDARRGEHEPAATRTRVVEIHVPSTSSVVGKSLAELGLPRGALVITISRDGEFVVPSGQTEIHADDALLVLADTDMARTIERLVLDPQPEAT
jgi:Trk K+ transport system NAD-binding subunit